MLHLQLQQGSSHPNHLGIHFPALSLDYREGGSIHPSHILVHLGPNPAYPDPNCQFIVEVDTSGIRISAFLSQKDSKDLKLYPRSFLSQRLSLAEENYDVGIQELLAVVLALQE